MNAAETNVQLQHHVVDSYQEFYDETLKGGGGKNNTELLKYFSEHAALAIDWLADHNIILDELTITGGMSKMRTHRPHSLAAIGGFLVTELLKQVQKARIPLFAGLKVTELTTDDAGKVTGVRATTGKQSGPLTADAVVLAAGGFGANQEMLTKYRPDLKGMNTTNQPGATGDGIKLAEALGAKLVDMDQVQVHPTVQQDTPHAYLIGEAVRGEGAILVNKHGDRFVNELDTRKNVTAAIDGLKENGAYLIFDQGIRDRAKAVEFYDSIGLVHTGKSLDDLAGQLGFDAAALKKAVADWNTALLIKTMQRLTGRLGWNAIFRRHHSSPFILHQPFTIRWAGLPSITRQKCLTMMVKPSRGSMLPVKLLVVCMETTESAVTRSLKR